MYKTIFKLGYDDVEEPEESNTAEEACLKASAWDCECACDYVEVAREAGETRAIVFWANAEGERGTDLASDDPDYPLAHEMINK